MEQTSTEIDDDVKFYLKNALPDVILNNYTIEITGTSEKGDGYIGDIFFVNLNGKNTNSKKLSLVLKCGKKSKALRKATPMKEAFENEIYIYDVVFPAFKKFQEDRGIKNIFDNYPKCFGTFANKDVEVIALENLKNIGYDLYDKKKSMTRKHIELVMKTYGKWHATSAAMQNQEPDKFQEISSKIIDVWTLFMLQTDLSKVFVDGLMDSIKIFQNEFDENIFTEWRKFKDLVDEEIKTIRRYNKSLTVIIHGDCWNNNFMFNIKDGILQAKLIDWQLTAIASPIVDLANYLYTCISIEDIEDFDDILKLYYQSFSEHLTNLGSDPEKIWSFAQFWKDWKIVGRYGIIVAPTMSKIIFAEKKDIPDISASAEKGESFADSFKVAVTNKEEYKRKLQHIIDHALKRGIIKPYKK